MGLTVQVNEACEGNEIESAAPAFHFAPGEITPVNVVLNGRSGAVVHLRGFFDSHKGIEVTIHMEIIASY